MGGPASSRGPLARLLYGSTGSEIVVGDESLTVGGNEIPLSSLSALVAREDGLLWSRATVQTVGGARTIRGFPRDSLTAVIEAANARLVDQLQARYAHLTAEIKAVAGEIDEILLGETYIRQSQYRRVVDQAQKLTGISGELLWRKFASQAQRAGIGQIARFLEDSGQDVAQLNAAVVERELASFAEFFATIETMPLTNAQRRACVIAEDNNLVLAGAGTGKTSVMIGRAGYLISSGKARPDELLMLAYGRKAAEEMQERQDKRLGSLLGAGTPTIKTFHALGLEIIGQAEGRRPDLTVLAQDRLQFTKFVDEAIASQCEEDEYRQRLIRYCGTERFPYRNWFDFSTEVLYYRRNNALT